MSTTASECASRFLANLYLSPRVVRLLVDHWLRTYHPLPIQIPGCPTPESNDAGEWVSVLVRRLLTAPDDIILTGRGGMATSETADEPRWIHRLSFVSPATDFSLAVPVAHLVRESALSLCVSLQDVYRHNDVLWNRAVHGGMHGQHWFDCWTDSVPASTYYHPAVFVLALMCRFLELLIAGLPHRVQSTDGFRALEVAIAPLRDTYMAHTCEASDRDVLTEYRQSIIGLQGHDRLERALETTRRFEERVMTNVAREYGNLREKYGSTIDTSTPHYLIPLQTRTETDTDDMEE